MTRILVDTHILLEITNRSVAKNRPALAKSLFSIRAQNAVSVVSFWEIAIKSRLGKLDPGMDLEDMSNAAIEAGMIILPIELRHVLVKLEADPPTRDPFDRLLLAICQVEGYKLATVDRALVGHPLALDTKGAIP